MQNQDSLSDHRFVRVFSGHGFGYSLKCIFKHVGNKKARLAARFFIVVFISIYDSLDLKSE